MSVLVQDYQPIELLVIDDGSTEDIASAVYAVAQDRARVIRRKARGGAAAARNTGCGEAKYNTLAFLDSDDEWLPHKLKAQISYLDEHPEIQLCCSAYEIVRPNGARETRGYKTPTATHHELAFGCELSPGSSLVVRREFFNRIGPFDENLERFEDWDWLLRAAGASEIGLVNEPLCRIHAGDRPPEILVRRAAEMIKFKHGPHFQQMGALPSLKFRAGLLHEQAVAAHSANRPMAAALALMLSLTLYPIRPRNLYPRIWKSF